MENAEKIDISKRPKDEREVNPGCSFWIFGDEKSADKDLKDKFEVVDEENPDHDETV